ncbi:MAG: recombinase family protein [Eubacteriales bacterium]|nr:recombinase family protein [Eubacteriales bacterium]
MPAKQLPAQSRPVVGYVRVSTENQLENYSIDEQRRRVSAYCQAKGWRLRQIYTDGGFSGGTTDRPALRRMLDEIRKGGVAAVVVYKLDRLSRSQKDTLTLIEDEFLANGADFVSICENFDTSTPFGRAMIGILSVFAQLEKEQITERFTMGRIGRGKAGYYHGGPSIPFGYRYADGLLAPDAYRAALVREIFERFCAGQSLSSICRAMEQACPGKWSTAKLRYLLRNTNYIGKVKFRGVTYDGVHQPLVGRQTFEAAQRLLDARRANGAPFRAGTLLSGLLYCGRCGARYAGAHGFYKCYSRAKTSKARVIDPACNNAHWKTEALDGAVWQQLALLLSPAVLASALREEDGAPPPDPAAARRRLTQIEAERGRLAELYQTGALPLDTLTARAAALRAEAGGLHALLAAQAPPAPAPDERAARTAERLARGFPDAPLETRRQLVRSLIRKITLDGPSVRIEWRV